jgi:peptidyl-tRNA hydrolase, PTH1 family
MKKFLIVGLGNPGSEYAYTRHNVGFLIAENLVSGENGAFEPGRLADVARIKYKGRPVTVIKPTTFMNLSGKAVNYWMQEENVDPENLLVLVDELALPFGKIRIGPKGSDGGHNGLKSIQDVIGTTSYPRLRFGIGNIYSKGAQVNYVLGSWNDEEKVTLNERITLAADAVRAFVFGGLQQSMNNFNNK